MPRAQARIKPLGGREDRRQDGKFQAHCGRAGCDKFLTYVDVHEDGSVVAFRVPWDQHDTGVWWLTESAQNKRAGDLQNLQKGALSEAERKKARSRLQGNFYPRDVRVRTPRDHSENRKSSYTSLPIEMKCPQCPTINLVSFDSD